RAAVFNHDIWKSWFVTMNAAFNAAGNELDTPGIERSMNLFVKDKTLAMWAGNDILHSLVTSTEGLNWDVVSLPLHPEVSSVSEKVSVKQHGPFWVVSETEENSEEVYLILSYFFTPVTFRNDLKYSFGEVSNKIKGKNIF